MSFENPYIFLLLMIPFILFAFLVLTNKEGIERVFSKKVLERIKVENSGISNKLRNIFIFLSIFFMIVAMSHPIIKKGEKKLKISGLELAIALDLSASMRTKDVYPNRLMFAISKTKELLNSLSNDEVMILAFSQDVFLLSPFTNDKDTLDSVLSGVSTDYILDKTNLVNLANALSKVLKGKSEKIAIIVTDGGDNKTINQFQNILKQEHIIPYIILIGSQAGGALLDKKGKVVIKNGNVVTTAINMQLAKVAKSLGGDYIVASYDGDDVKKLINKIKQKHHNIYFSKKSIKVVDKIELFYYPLILALIFLILSFIEIPKSFEDIELNILKKGKR